MLKKLIDKKFLKPLSIGLLMLVIIGYIYLVNSKLQVDLPEDAEFGNVYEKAQVEEILKETLEPDPDFKYINIGKQYVKLKISSGENKEKIVETINFIGRVDNRPLKVGSKVVISSYDNFRTTVISNYNRENPIYLLILIFMVVVLFFGGKKGAKSLFSLVFTMGLIIFLFIPLVIKGVNPIIASIIVVILATLVTIISLNGIKKKALVAISSCVICTIIAGAIAYLFGILTNISTFNTSEIEDLLFVARSSGLEVKNLLFAGILIASLGAIMDTTISITSAVFEINNINPELTRGELFKSAMNIGKDIMGTMTNTLILAFTGSSINILIIYYIYQFPYIQFINLDLIVIEILQGLSGAIAIILSIPITGILACFFAKKEKNNEIGEKVYE
ncbi:MAG: YibE/F family protein [Sarcina sp.]